MIGSWSPHDTVYLVAEIGSNHNGEFSVATELLREAAAAGVDAVKFQRYNAEYLVHKDVPTMAHVRGLHRTQRERMASLQFSDQQWRQLAALASELGVTFLASAFDEASADALDPLVPAFKIASGDLTHLRLIRHVAAKGKPVIVSTGMASEHEIAAAVSVVPPDRLVLMYCVSRYPTPAAELDLLTIPWLAERFDAPVGYSDHTIGITASIAAVALGAVMIEKHFTLDRTQPIGDHRLSAEPAEMKALVEQARDAWVMRGSVRREPRAGEFAMRGPLRRGLYARTDLPAGTSIAADQFVALRPEQGIAPARMDQIAGRHLKRPVAADVALTDDDV